MNKVYKYLFDFPTPLLSKISSVSTILFFLYLIFFNEKIQNTELIFLITTPLIWSGCTFFLLTLLVKYTYPLKEVSFAAKLFIIFCSIIIIISFLLPIVCYFLIRDANLELEQLKKAMHHN